MVAITLFRLSGGLYVLVAPVVKLVFGLKAAGSATCKEKLLSFFSRQKRLLQPWAFADGKILMYKLSEEEQQK